MTQYSIIFGTKNCNFFKYSLEYTFYSARQYKNKLIALRFLALQRSVARYLLSVSHIRYLLGQLYQTG